MKIRFESKNKYNPTDVLLRLSEETIYSYYLDQNINGHDAFKCCFHEDKTPSLRFKRMHSGKLIYNCFGCGNKGDIFTFVSNLHKIPYQEAVKLIVDTFEGEKSDIIKYKPKVIETYKDSDTKIHPFFKHFDFEDIVYWNSFNISINTLKKFNVKTCNKVFIFGKTNPVELSYVKNNPIFIYDLGGEKYKVYRPLNPTKKGKFFSNANEFDIQGMNQLPDKGEKLIVTSSLKDVMVLSEIGYNAIAPQGEGINIPENVVDHLYACFNDIFVLYDSDEAGYKYSDKISKRYGFNPIHIPNEYNTKDISDFSKKFGLKKTKLLIEKLVNG